MHHITAFHMQNSAVSTVCDAELICCKQFVLCVYFSFFFLLLLPFTVNKDVYKIPKHFFGGEGDGGLWPFHIPLRHD